MQGTQAVNPERGEVLLEVKDAAGTVQRSYVLIMKTNAIAKLEKLLNEEIHVTGERMKTRRPGMGDLRAMLCAALGTKHPEMSLEDAGDLIDDVGFEPVLNAVLESLTLGFPMAAMEKATKGGNGEAGKGHGTGAGSSGTRRARGSVPTSSGS